MAASRVGVRRLQRELVQVHAQGISPTVHIAPHSSDMTTMDALIIGPPDTPYDGAMLHFRIKVPPEYPLKPPQVRFMNTDGGVLRIHPQLYADGKVCLSILGTWHGPKWSASQSIASVLLSIQSLLTQDPLRNEPGLESSSQEAVDRANVFVVHEAMRVLVLRQLAGPPSWGKSEDVEPLTVAMHSHLRERRADMLKRLAEMSKKHDTQVLREPFVFAAMSSRRRYNFAALAAKLEELLPESVGDRATPSSSSSAPAGASGSAPPRAPRPEERPAEDAEGSDEEGTQAHCRICHQTAEESPEPLIAPCLCAGSIRYAHAKCILKWLEHSGQAVSSKYRCDICRAKFRVTLGGGKPPGYAYFLRDLDVFGDSGFDAPGLVAALFISFIQAFTNALGRVLAQSLYWCAVILCTPCPTWIRGWLLVGLQVPVLLLEVATNLLYLALLCVKGAVIWWGPQWRPHDWGEFGQGLVDYILGVGVIFENFFALGLRLDGVILLALYFSVTHVCCLVSGHSIIGMLLRASLGSERAQHYLAFDPGLSKPFPTVQRLFPGTSPAVMWYVHRPAECVSLLLNLFTIAGLLKRAFFNSRSVPVEVLPASSLSRSSPRVTAAVSAPDCTSERKDV